MEGNHWYVRSPEVSETKCPISLSGLVYAIPMKNASSGKARGHISRFGGSKQFLAGVSAKLGRGSKVEVWPMPSLIADGRDANNTRG